MFSHEWFRIHLQREQFFSHVFEEGRPHPISLSPFQGFNGFFKYFVTILDLILPKCEQFIINTMVSNTPNTGPVYARSHRQTRMLTRHPQNHHIIFVWSYYKMDGLVIDKNCTLMIFNSDRKKLYSGVKTRTPPPLVMKWEAPNRYLFWSARGSGIYVHSYSKLT